MSENSVAMWKINDAKNEETIISSDRWRQSLATRHEIFVFVCVCKKSSQCKIRYYYLCDTA